MKRWIFCTIYLRVVCLSCHTYVIPSVTLKKSSYRAASSRYGRYSNRRSCGSIGTVDSASKHKAFSYVHPEQGGDRKPLWCDMEDVECRLRLAVVETAGRKGQEVLRLGPHHDQSVYTDDRLQECFCKSCLCR